MYIFLHSCNTTTVPRFLYSSSYKMSELNPDYVEGEYKAVQELVSHLKDGNLIKQQVGTKSDYGL